MKTIPLTQGKIALVDDADFDWLNQWKWCTFAQRTENYYAVRQNWNDKTKKSYLLRMHREILGLKHKDGIITDHKNCDGLDNQRHNLRICTNAENLCNQKPKLHSSAFKGVSWNKKAAKWGTYIRSNHKRYFLGYFDSEIEAAKVYDKVAKELFGEFACLNFPD